MRAPSLCEDIDAGENEVDQPLNDSLMSQGSISWSPLSISLVSLRISLKTGIYGKLDSSRSGGEPATNRRSP